MQDNLPELACGAVFVDVEVKPIDNGTCSIVDLLGRPVGNIVQTDRGFLVAQDHRSGLLAGVEPGPFATLDLALAAVERRARGSCRLIG